MYFMMIDRFLNGDPSNDRLVEDPEVHPKANFYGGDIAQVSTKRSRMVSSDLSG